MCNKYYLDQVVQFLYFLKRFIIYFIYNIEYRFH